MCIEYVCVRAISVNSEVTVHFEVTYDFSYHDIRMAISIRSLTSVSFSRTGRVCRSPHSRIRVPFCEAVRGSRAWLSLWVHTRVFHEKASYSPEG